MSTIFTIGHSTRSVDEFMQLLVEAGVNCLIDVRAYPVSRRHPQFSRERLEKVLAEERMQYAWEGKDLGGFRQPLAGSRNVALKATAFRGYADHMVSSDFLAAARRVTASAGGHVCVLMCAEKDPARCHRKFIADYLLSNGMAVMHLIDSGLREAHQLSAAATISEAGIVYDGRRAQRGLEF